MGSSSGGGGIGSIWDDISDGTVDAWDAIEDGSVDVLDAIANGTIDAAEAIENGTLDVVDAIDRGAINAMEAVEEGFISLGYLLEEGYATSLDAFSYIGNIAAYNATGEYYGTKKNDLIIAADIFGAIPASGWLRNIWGSGQGKIYAKDGDDTIIMASFAATVYTGAGNDSVFGGSADLTIKDTSGNLTIGTATLLSDINKTGDGNITFGGVSGLLDINHSGDHGDVAAYSLALVNKINLSGVSGDIIFYGGGGGNIIDHDVSDRGKIEFYGAGVANIITASGNHTDIDFYGAGAFNVIINDAAEGDMNIYALGIGNLIIKNGDGYFNTYLAATANVAIHIGDGDGKVATLGALNTYTKIGDGDSILAMAGGLNVATLIGNGDIYGGLLGAGNVVTKVGKGDVYIGLAASGNVFSQIDNSGHNSDTIIVALGGSNVVTKVGNGELTAAMIGGGNVTTHIGAGDVNSGQLGGGNILTKIGDGDVNSVQLGKANILTQIGSGQSLAVMGGDANVFTKVGDGLTAAAMMASGNLFTHIGDGDSYGLMAGTGNIFTKVGGLDSDKILAAMFGTGNLFTHIGDGLTAALMMGTGNIFTKVGNGTTIAALIASNNIATHVGNGDDYAFMVGSNNIFTKVGDGQIVAFMSGSNNVSTHIGDGRQINVTSASNNILSKLGEGDQINVAIGSNNLLTHVDLTGTSDSYNFANGSNNIVTKIGDGMQISALIGTNNIVTHIGDGDAYELAYGGQGNVMTKVGDGDLIVGLMGAKLNVITQIGDGKGYYGMWGDNNVATKIGDGQAVVVMQGDNNVITNVGDGKQIALMSGDNNVNVKIGDGSSINIINGTNNVITKVGDGLHLAAMKGDVNINIQIGDGTGIATMHANQNLTVKIGNGDFYGLSIARSTSSYADMLVALLTQIKDTTMGYMASDIIGQLVWGPEDEEDDQSNAPELGETPSPTITADTSIDIGVIDESDLEEDISDIENAAIDHDDLPESDNAPILVDGSQYKKNYEALIDSYDGSNTGDIILTQEKVAMANSVELKKNTTTILVGDYNGDNVDDFIKQKDGAEAKIYLSNGDGSFDITSFVEDGNQMQRNLTVLTVGDYNGDGRDDFIRQRKTEGGSSNIADAYISDGDGTFTRQDIVDDHLLVGSFTNIIVGDYNGDGKDDFIRQEKGSWDDDNEKTAMIFLSSDDGFEERSHLTNHNIMGGDNVNIIVGDYNGDGKDDFIRQEKASYDDDNDKTAELYLSNGDGTFSSQLLTDYINMKGDKTNIIVGDYNGDGKDDFIRQEKDDWDNDDILTAELYLSNGNGTFSAQLLTDYEEMKGDKTKLIVGDYNGDGRDDFIRQEKSDIQDGYDTAQLYIANADGSFTRKGIVENRSMKGDYNNLIIGDYDGNGRDDFIKQEKAELGYDDYNSASLYLHKDGYTVFDDVELNISGGAIKGDTANLMVGDYNGDGIDDFIRQGKDAAFDTANSLNSMHISYLSNGDGTFSATLLSEYDTKDDTNIMVGDYNGDGKDDFITQERTSGSATAKIYLSKGDGRFADQLLTDSEDMEGRDTKLIIGDYNGDGKDDFIRQEIGSYSSDDIRTAEMYLSDGDGTFTSQLLTDYQDMKGYFANIIIGDYNGDGKDDFIRQEIGSSASDDIRTAEIYLSDGDGTFSKQLLTDYEDMKGYRVNIIVGDYNGDGKDDFIRQEIGSSATDDIRTAEMYLSDGDGTFTKQLLTNHVDMKGYLTNLVVADYNGDGMDDFIRQEKNISNGHYNAATLYLANGDGRFRKKEITNADVMKEDLANLVIGDYDGDGRDDFIRQDHTATSDLYLSTVNTASTDQAAASENFTIDDEINNSGNSSLSDAGSAEVNQSVSEGNGDITSLTQEGSALLEEAEGVQNSLINSADALLSHLSGLSDDYSADDNQSASDGDGARNDYTVGIVDIDSHLDIAESDTNEVITDAQANTDDAKNELSEADLNADQADSDAATSQTVDTAQSDATTQENQAQSDSTQTQNDANAADTTATNQSDRASSKYNDYNINDNDYNLDDREESEGSGLSTETGKQSGIEFDYATAEEAEANQNQLLTPEDEEALEEALQALHNLGSNQGGDSNSSHDPVNTGGEGIDNNSAAADISNTNFLADGGEFSDVLFGPGAEEPATSSDDGPSPKKIKIGNQNDYEGARKGVNPGIIAIKDSIKGDKLFISTAYDEIYSYTVNAFGEEGGVLLSDPNKTLIAKLRKQYEDTSATAGSRAKIGTEVFDSFFDGSNLLLRVTLPKELFAIVTTPGTPTDAAEFIQTVTNSLNTKLQSKLTSTFFDVDPESGEAVVKSTNTFGYSAIDNSLNNVGYELIDVDNQAKSSSSGTNIKNKWVDSLPSNDSSAELLKSLVFDEHGRSERDAYAKSIVYKEVYGNELVNPDGDNGINGIWNSITQERGLADTYLFTDSGKASSINHILAESSIAVLLSDAAFKISKMDSDSAEKITALETMKAFFDKVAGVSDGGFGGKSQSFSDIANAHFVAAVASSNIDLTELSHSMAAISYAPGNVRWGDGSLNSARGNFLDPIFTQGSNGIVELSDSSISVKNAVESLNGIVDVSVTNAALSMDMHIAGTDARMYSTNKIIGGTGVDITPGTNGEIRLGEHLLKIFDYSKETGMKSVTKIGDSGSVENSIEYKFKPDGNIGSVESVNGEDVFVAKTFNHTQEEANNLADRQKSHDLIKNEDGTFAQNEDGTFKTKLTEKDSSYQAIDKGIDIVVYKYTDSAGEISYRVVNTEQEYSIYMKTPPVIDASGHLDLSGRSAHTYGHGEKTGTTYTKNSSSLTSSFYGADDKILQSSPLGIIDNANQGRYDETISGDVVDDYKLTKAREEYLAGEDAYQKKHLDQLMHASIDKMGANDIVIVPGKYSDLTRQTLESDLSSYGVTDNRMHICRGDDLNQVHTLTISDSTKDIASDLKDKIVDNISGSSSSNYDNTIDSDVEAVRNNTPEIESGTRQASYRPGDSSGSIYTGPNLDSTKGNIQLQVGDGEYVAGFWGENNLGLKIGEGGFKGTVFGENNILAHIGNAGDDVSYATSVGGYDAFEGAQLMIGTKNLSFNYGDSNDFIVTLDKSIPLPPFVSPFSGPSNIVGFLKDDVVALGEEIITDEFGEESIYRGEDFYYKQNQLWSYGQAESIVSNVSGLDQNSAVYYESIFDYGSETDRDTRALQADIEASLNKQYNEWASPGANGSQGMEDVQANIVIAGQGADIIMANGENQFLFGDNIQSVLDTTLNSLFGMMTQDSGENGMPTSTMSYDPTQLPQKLKDQLLNVVAVSLPEITLGDIFAVDYNANGSIYKSDGADLTGDEMTDVLEVMAQFGNQTIARYLTPDGIMDNIKASISLAEGAADQIKTTFGLGTSADSDPSAPPTASGDLAEEEDGSSSDETLGFGGLTLPSIFSMADISDSFSSIPNLINDLAGTINGFGGDAANIQDAILDFFTTSGYMTDDGDLMVSLGDSNYSWGGHGNDIGAFLGLNNNFWGGRGDDMFYGMGENNQASGNHGNDTGILLGLNNLFLGGQGDDFALASGRLNNLSGGTGNDSLFAFGSDTWLMGDEGDDYLMSAGIFTTIQAGEGHDYIVSSGHYANINGEEGKDSISIFGNENNVLGGNDNDMIRILGHQSTADGESGNDLMTLDVKAKNNLVQGGTGDDKFVLGGYDNTLYGNSGSDQFLINHNIIHNTIKDITADDFILFEDVSYSDLWFEKQGDDLEIYVDRGFSDEELQSTPGLINEAIGLASFTDYFLHNATGSLTNIAINYTDSDNYAVLNSAAINQLIAIMDNYEIDAYADGFFSNVSFDDEELILSAWQNTTNYITGDDTNNVLYGYETGENIILDGSGSSVIFGGWNNDALHGNAGDDSIFGDSGDDEITGDDGNDIIYGDAGNDIISGGNGNDIIEGGLNDDTLSGDDGDDMIDGGEGADIILGGIGNDLLAGNQDDDIIYGHEGNDTIYGGDGDDFADSGDGDDQINGHAGDDTLHGGNGVDTIYGDDGNDELYGDDGDDMIYGGKGDDTISGGIGDDVLDGNKNNDTIYGHEGNDTIYGGTGNDFADSGDGNDEIHGHAGDDTLHGGNGADIIYGDDGEDIIKGENDNDEIYGGDGNDSISGGNGDDVANGGDGDDQINGNAGDDTLYGGYGGDNIQGSAGNDIIYGGFGSDELYGDNGADTIYGGWQSDLIKGGNNTDTLYGGGANDTIYGDKGNDYLDGGDADDTLFGGIGADNLTGGSGNDIFSFEFLTDSTSTSSDIITDFTQGEDSINLSDLTFTGITSDQSQTDDQILTYEYDSAQDQTIVSNESNTFEFKLEGNIALDVNDFDFAV